MARLDTLPVELLHAIAGSVSSNAVMLDAKGETPDDKPRWADSDLAALSCTNRQFHQIFTPYLYQWDQEYGSYAMSWAIQTSTYETLEKTLSLGYHLDSIITLAKRWRNYKENQRHRPIEIAILFEEHRLLKWLLEHGASADPGPVQDVQLKDGSVQRMAQGRNSSPLYRALVQLSDDAAAVILLDGGARTRFGRDDTFFYGCTALHLAATRGLEKTVERLLLLEDTLNINEKDWHGHTALHLAVLEQDLRTAIMKNLLRHGANPHTSNNENTTAIESAVLTGHLDNVLALFQVMANTSPPDGGQAWTHPVVLRIVTALRERRLERYDFDYPQEVKMILAKLIEVSAKVDNPPPPHFDDAVVNGDDADDAAGQPLTLELLRPWAAAMGVSREPIIFETLLSLGLNRPTIVCSMRGPAAA